MEVHHHAHIPSGREKKWTHYLWEFLMLFLAVFCGFLAENQREHYVEGLREKKYIQNLLHDLARDTVNYNLSITLRLERESQAHQLITSLYSPERDKHLAQLYYFARQMPRMNTIFYSTDATMNQLKNSGALRLIKKAEIADSIVAYNAAMEAYAENRKTEIETRIAFRNAVGNVFDASVLLAMIDSGGDDLEKTVIPPTFVKPLITDDRKTINHLCTQVHFLYSQSIIGRKALHRYKEQASRLIELLKKEYHL
jgi:hypothetical protein